MRSATTASGCGARTLLWLLTRHATEQLDAVALQDARRALTWSELKRWTDGVAADLREYGLGRWRPCDDVALEPRGGSRHVLACVREGVACNPSVHKTPCAEVGELLHDTFGACASTEDGWGTDRATVDFDAALVRIKSLKVVFTRRRSFSCACAQQHSALHGPPARSRISLSPSEDDGHAEVRHAFRATRCSQMHAISSPTGKRGSWRLVILSLLHALRITSLG